MKGLHLWDKNSTWNKHHQSWMYMNRTTKSVISSSLSSFPLSFLFSSSSYLLLMSLTWVSMLIHLFFFTHSFIFFFFVCVLCVLLFFLQKLYLMIIIMMMGMMMMTLIPITYLEYIICQTLSILPKLIYLMIPQILRNRCYSSFQLAEVETGSWA